MVEVGECFFLTSLQYNKDSAPAFVRELQGLNFMMCRIKLRLLYLMQLDLYQQATTLTEIGYDLKNCATLTVNNCAQSAWLY